MKLYILDGHTPVLVRDPITWGLWFEKAGLQVVAKTLIGESEVSTVFLGVDTTFRDGPPILFETMVFGGPLDGERVRYATWEEAEAGHARMVAACKVAMPP